MSVEEVADDVVDEKEEEDDDAEELEGVHRRRTELKSRMRPSETRMRTRSQPEHLISSVNKRGVEAIDVEEVLGVTNNLHVSVGGRS